jgi:HD-GYP domain-containing protein (c-di-GMP phosphodiesterase class II)
MARTDKTSLGRQHHRCAAARPAPRPGLCAACLDEAERSTARRMRWTHLESARALAAAVEAKDPFTREHSSVVCDYALGLALRLKLPKSRLRVLRVAALLHDIGKIGVPDAVLQKPGPLTPTEFKLIKRHPRLATTILRHASFFENALPIILHHHEWFDGSGYPEGLAGNDIPQEARILGVADALDAMLSPRSYKVGYSIQRVRRELIAFSGRQFDPQVAAVAVRWLDRQPRRFARTHHPC